MRLYSSACVYCHTHFVQNWTRSLHPRFDALSVKLIITEMTDGISSPAVVKIQSTHFLCRRQYTSTEAMADATTTTTEDVFDDSYEEKSGPKPPVQIVWRNVLLMSLLHLGALYGLTIVPFVSSLTIIWSKCYCLFCE